MKAEEEKHMGEGEDEARPWREGQSRGAPRGAVLASRVKPRGKPAGRFERGHSAWRSTSQEKQLGVEGAEGGEVGAGQRAVGRAPVAKLSALSSVVEKAVSSGTQSSVAQKERASSA